MVIFACKKRDKDKPKDRVREHNSPCIHLFPWMRSVSNLPYSNCWIHIIHDVYKVKGKRHKSIGEQDFCPPDLLPSLVLLVPDWTFRFQIWTLRKSSPLVKWPCFFQLLCLGMDLLIFHKQTKGWATNPNKELLIMGLRNEISCHVKLKQKHIRTFKFLCQHSQTDYVLRLDV